MRSNRPNNIVVLCKHQNYTCMLQSFHSSTVAGLEDGYASLLHQRTLARLPQVSNVDYCSFSWRNINSYFKSF